MSGSWWMSMAGSWWRGASRDSLIWGCRVGTSSRGPWMGWSPLLHPLLPSSLISSSHPPHHCGGRRDLKGAPLTSRPYFAGGRRRPGSGGLCLVQEGLPGRGGGEDSSVRRCTLSTGLAASRVPLTRPSPAPLLLPSSTAFTTVCNFSPSCVVPASPKPGPGQEAPSTRSVSEPHPGRLTQEMSLFPLRRLGRAETPPRCHMVTSPLRRGWI